MKMKFSIFSYYAEFFWFPNNGYDDGYWENCWKNDGEENEAVDLNDNIEDNFQIASTYLFDITTLILQPLVMVSREEHYDQDITLREIIRHIFTKVNIAIIPHHLAIFIKKFLIISLNFSDNFIDWAQSVTSTKNSYHNLFSRSPAF